MSRRVPQWLRHLRTDRRGLPVPYVNLWGPAEDPDKWSIRPDRLVRGPALFYDDDAEDIPDFTRQNIQRQRQCMIAGLCQVCGRTLPWGNRYLAIASLSVETVELGGHQVPVVTEPWLCGLCGLFATRTCPALIRRKTDEQLQLVPVTAQDQFTMTYSQGWVEGPVEEESKRIQPAMWVKVALHRLHLDNRAAGTPS